MNHTFWELDPSWVCYMKIDLKDGFFSIPISDDISRFFGFSWGVKRYK